MLPYLNFNVHFSDTLVLSRIPGLKLPRGKISLDMKSPEAAHPMYTALFSRAIFNIFSPLIIYSNRE